MNTTAELAAQLRALAESDRPELDAEERAALQDAAGRLDRGQGAVYTIGRLLAPFLGRLVKSKPTTVAAPTLVVDQQPPRWTAGWDRHQGTQRAYRGPK